MQLQVIGKPTIKATDKQRLLVTYNPQRDSTNIDCNVDVVTLGITICVLQNLFTDAIQKLDPSMANEITETTRKVAMHYAKY